MPHTDFMIRVEALMQETNCTREHAHQAVLAAMGGSRVARTRAETREETVLRRARALMAKGMGWSRAIAVAADTME